VAPALCDRSQDACAKIVPLKMELIPRIVELPTYNGALGYYIPSRKHDSRDVCLRNPSGSPHSIRIHPAERAVAIV